VSVSEGLTSVGEKIMVTLQPYSVCFVAALMRLAEQGDRNSSILIGARERHRKKEREMGMAEWALCSCAHTHTHTHTHTHSFTHTHTHTSPPTRCKRRV